MAFQLLDKAKWTASAEVVLEDKGYDPGDTLGTFIENFLKRCF